MRIYAVYDLMISYFMNPFVAQNDETVLASISQDISRPDNPNAIAYAPHHFQVWKLGEINENGDINPGKQLVCDCSTLVRPRRTATDGELQAHSEATHAFGVRPERANGSHSVTGTGTEAVQKSASVKHIADEH